MSNEGAYEFSVLDHQAALSAWNNSEFDDGATSSSINTRELYVEPAPAETPNDEDEGSDVPILPGGAPMDPVLGDEAGNDAGGSRSGFFCLMGLGTLVILGGIVSIVMWQTGQFETAASAIEGPTSPAPTTVVPVETVSPTSAPIAPPTPPPSPIPTAATSTSPSISLSPTEAVTDSLSPSEFPSVVASSAPSVVPTTVPSWFPSTSTFPTISMSPSTSVFPTSAITESFAPSESASPSMSPSLTKSGVPSLMPSMRPSLLPSIVPSPSPSAFPSGTPTMVPTTFVPVRTKSPLSADQVADLPEPGTFPACNPCGGTLVMSNLDAEVSAIGFGTATCYTLLCISEDGQIDPAFCPFLTSFVTPCECVPEDTP